MWQAGRDNRSGPVRWYRYAAGQPSWVTRWALLAIVVVVVVPLVTLALAGLVVGLVVFVTLGVVARVIGLIRALFGGGGGPADDDDDGRRNVRVMDPD